MAVSSTVSALFRTSMTFGSPCIPRISLRSVVQVVSGEAGVSIPGEVERPPRADALGSPGGQPLEANGQRMQPLFAALCATVTLRECASGLLQHVGDRH